MNEVPATHPRARSLALRERLVWGLRQGLVTESGLIAHGRGEAFDYLLGERSHPFALEAVAAASALLTLAQHPVLSINGNAAALAAADYVALARENPRLLLEVNLFYYTPARANNIVRHLSECGANQVYFSRGPGSVLLPGTDNPRREVHPEGMAKADVVFLALEDGDRCEALIAAGKQAICVDLNPLSRTAQKCHVTIVDELTRVLPALAEQMRADLCRSRKELHERAAGYDNLAILDQSITAIRNGNL